MTSDGSPVGHEVVIAGEGVRLSLRLLWWERSGLASGSDANWIDAEVELSAGSTGRFSARQRISVRTEELARFRDQLASLLDSLTGEAALETIEDEVGVRITLNAGAGDLEAFVAEPAGARLTVKDLRTDQSYLAETLRGLEAAVAAFGVRGDPHD